MNTSSLVSIEDYTKDEILEVLKLASAFEENPNQRLLEGKVVASLFFEPSTRTRLTVWEDVLSVFLMLLLPV